MVDDHSLEELLCVGVFELLVSERPIAQPSVLRTFVRLLICQ